MSFLRGNPELPPPEPVAPPVVDATAAKTEDARQERLKRIMELQAQKRASVYGTLSETLNANSDILGGKSFLG